MTPKTFAIPALALGAALLCHHFGLRFLRDSDQANALFEAMDMVSGNPLLRGWVTPPDNFWLIDLPGLGLLSRFTSDMRAPLYILPAIWWGGIVWAACLLVEARHTMARHGDWRKFLPVILFLGLPPLYEPGPIGFLTYTPYHVGTLFFTLIGLLTVERCLRPGSHLAAGISLGFIVGILEISDAFATCCFIVPTLVTSLWMARRGIERRAALRIAAILAASFGLVALARLVLSLAGGFHASHLTIHFMSTRQMHDHLHFSRLSLGDLFGVSLDDKKFFGPAPGKAAEALLRLAALFPVLLWLSWQTIRLLPQAFRRTTPTPFDPVTAILILGTACAGGAAIFLDFYIAGEDIIRYFLPILIYGTIAFARSGPTVGMAWLFVPAIAWTLAIFAQTWSPRPDTDRLIDPYHVAHQMDVEPLLALLDAEGLTQGYGNYWYASLTTLASQGHTTIRAVTTDSHNTDGFCALSPLAWLSQRSWYRPEALADKARIFILADLTRPFFNSGLDQSAIIASLGPPERIISFPHPPSGNLMAIDVYPRETLLACQTLFDWPDP